MGGRMRRSGRCMKRSIESAVSSPARGAPADGTRATLVTDMLSVLARPSHSSAILDDGVTRIEATFGRPPGTAAAAASGTSTWSVHEVGKRTRSGAIALTMVSSGSTVAHGPSAAAALAKAALPVPAATAATVVINFRRFEVLIIG